MRQLYLVLAIVGFLVTYGLAILFFSKYGWDFGMFWDRSIGNTAGASVVADATLSAIVFWIFVYRESRLLGMPRWWLYVLATFVFGLIVPFGLFLYFREPYLKKQ